MLEIAQVGTTIFYAIKYPNSGGTITSIGDHIKITGGYWYIDGVNTGVKAQGTDGATGAQGVGISSIAKTGTSGNVDTYTITLTNGSKSTFTVTNGTVSYSVVSEIPSDLSGYADGHVFILE